MNAYCSALQIWLRAIFVILLLGSISCSPKISTSHPISRDGLVKLFNSLEPWSYSTNYSPLGWQRARYVSETISQLDPVVVEEALEIFIRRSSNREDFGNWTKALIFFRVHFELPEHTLREDRFLSYAWLGSQGAENPDGTANLSWPVTWKGGYPRLIARLEGYEGSPYNPVEEFRFLRSRYPTRNWATN
jgi:hypothetical protein